VKDSVIAAFGDDTELLYPELVSRLPGMADLDLRAAVIALVDVDRRLTVTGHRGPGDNWSSLAFHRT
jgi:hypothetical protein